MINLVYGLLFLVTLTALPLQAAARVDISVNVTLPPPIAFVRPPQVILLPETDHVYVVPDIDVDLFFWNGWWWYLWNGLWYRSLYYDRGWEYYDAVPVFFYSVDPGWRRFYKNHNWYGRYWYYERIPHHRLQRDWSRWRDNRYWERRRTPGEWREYQLPPRPGIRQLPRGLEPPRFDHQRQEPPRQPRFHKPH